VDVRYALSAHLTAPKLRPKHLNCAQDWERQKDRKTQICAWVKKGEKTSVLYIHCSSKEPIVCRRYLGKLW
jgi:L-asparaginase II